MVSILIDDQIALRTLQPEDAQELFRAIDESRAHLRTWLGWVDGNTKPEHTLQFIHHAMQQQDAQTGMVLGIFHGTSIIGEIGMQHWDHAVKKAQLGYWMSQAWQGKGILHRSLVNFLDFLFEKVGLNKVEIHYIAANERSACVASRLGCQVEGVLRQSFLRHGKLEDLVVTGILRAEWQR